MTQTGSPTYWIIVGSPENFALTRALDSTMQGIKPRHRKKADRMKPGEMFFHYLTGLKAFAGISTITSNAFESLDRIWSSGDGKKEAEDYPFRVNTKPDLVLPEGEYALQNPSPAR